MFGGPQIQKSYRASTNDFLNFWPWLSKDCKKGLQTALPYSIITNVVKKDGPLLQKLY